MIVNVPTRDDFKRIAIECLLQAYNLIYEADKEVDVMSQDNVYYPDTSPQEFQENYSLLWKHKQPVLRNAVILIQQSHESLMKAEIANVSPLLLLENKRTDWPTLHRHKDKDFNTFYTIGAESLLYTYNAVLTKPASEELIKFAEEVRILRNKIIHSVFNEPLYPRYIVGLILYTFTLFLGRDSWWESIRENLFTNPFYGKIDKPFEEANLIEHLEDAERYFGRKELSNHFNQNLSNRGYYCPDCKISLEREDGEIHSKWAYLKPNTPTSRTIKCVCCLSEIEVSRTDCLSEDCRGNVLYEDICLTCLNM